MSTVLAPDRPLPEAARAALHEELTGALVLLSGPLSDTAVHEVRKHGKRIRASLRLLRPALGKKRCRRVARQVRDAARCLSELRDARVTRDLVLALDSALLEQVGPVLPLLPAPEARGVQRQGARDGLSRARTALDELPWKRVDAESLRNGLVRRWRAAQLGWQQALDHDGAEVLHDWRKDVKGLGYQARLLRARWPRSVEPLIEPLGQLGDLLGRHHDAAVLRELLQGAGLQSASLSEQLTSTQDVLVADARVLGRALFAREPTWIRGPVQASGSGESARVW